MHWFDIIICLVAAFAIVKGFMTGFISQLASLLGIILGAIFAGQLAYFIEPQMAKALGDSQVLGVVSYIVAFLIIFIILIVIGKMIAGFLKAIKLNFFNRLAGGVFCSLKWLFIISIILNMAVSIDKDMHIVKKDTREETRTYPLVIQLSQRLIPYLKFSKF